MRPPRNSPFPTETALSTACQKRIRVEYGGEVMKIHGSATQAAGQPDLLGCVRGRMIAVELKQPSKRPTPLQFRRLRSWAAAGALAGWARTEVDLDRLLAHLDDPAWANPQLADEPVDVLPAA